MEGDQISAAKVVIGGDDSPLRGALANSLAHLEKQMTAMGVAATGPLYPLARGMQSLFDMATAPLSTMKDMATSAFGPVMDAMSASLTNFRLWIDKAIEGESRMARFNAMLGNTGKLIGYTSDQLKIMRDNLAQTTSFSGKDLMGAQQALMSTGTIRGENFAEALRLSTDLAARMGTELPEAAHMLSRALENPQAAMRMLRAAGIHLDEQLLTDAKSLIDTGQVAEGQALILKALAPQMAGFAEAMLNTTEGRLAKLRQMWNSIGGEIGKALLPITDTASRVANVVVAQFARIAKPIIASVGGGIKSAMDSVNSFLADNQATFDRWGAMISVIVENLWNYVGDKLKSLGVSIDLSGAGAAWDTFSTKVTETLNELAVFTSNIDAFWDRLKVKAAELWSTVKEGAGSVWDKMKDALSAFFDNVIAKFGDKLETVLNTVLSGLPVVGEQYAEREVEHQRVMALNVQWDKDSAAMKAAQDKILADLAQPEFEHVPMLFRDRQAELADLEKRTQKRIDALLPKQKEVGPPEETAGYQGAFESKMIGGPTELYNQILQAAAGQQGPQERTASASEKMVTLLNAIRDIMSSREGNHAFSEQEASAIINGVTAGAAILG